MATMGRNSPFAGRELPGKVVATFFKGHPTVLNGELNTPYRHGANHEETAPASAPAGGY
jgi:dihydroorotase